METNRKPNETTVFTTVLNLRTGQELVYALPPEQAVVNAFYQYGPRKDYSTHEYDYSLAQRVRGTVVCGDFAARLSDQVLECLEFLRAFPP